MTLTKEQIEREIRIWSSPRNDNEGVVSRRMMLELCRLALLGLEREGRASRVAAFIEAEKEHGRSVLADSFGAFPDLEPDDEPKRDELAERVGRAAILAVDNGWSAHEVYSEIVDAMEAEGDRAPHAAHSDRVLADLRAMTPDQVRQTFIDAGIFDESGNLTEPYRG